MGTNTNNTIDINGKRYDARTGAFLGNSTAVVVSHPPVHRKKQSIDGFQRVSRGVAAQPLKPITQAHSSVVHPAAPKAHNRPAHKTAIHTKPHVPQKASTLMRSAVTKPVIKSPQHIKAHARTDILAKVPVHTVAPKISYHSVNKVRVNRAERMIKSPTVSRYGAVTDFAPATRRPQPILKPAIATPAVAVKSQPLSPERSELDIFEQAIAHATSHEQKYTPRKKSKKISRFASYTAATMAVFVLVGFIAYQNVPSLSVKLASTRAGFDAKLPSYQPSGYTFGNLSYGPGNVKVSYASEEIENMKFDITQRASDWDSQTLLSNFVMSASEAYKTYERAGRTIYLYGNNTATWVDSGVWYTVNGGGSLSNSQLLDLAISL